MSSSKTTIAVVALVVQNAGMILVSKYSFRKEAKEYSQAAALLVSEVLKLLTCIFLEFMEKKRNVAQLIKSVQSSPSNLSMIIPATLYVFQNLLQLAAIDGLSPALYVTGAQLKVLTSAFFTAMILRRTITTRQILSFFPLMAGVALVQWDSGGVTQPELRSNNLKAGLSLLSAVTISGLAGVLLEFSFRRDGESIWAKNMYLSFFSLPTASYAAFWDLQSKYRRDEGSYLTISNITYGFDAVVMMVVVLLALGGLLSAMVMKLAGTLTKCFAVSTSIVFCTIASVYYELEAFSPRIVVGVPLVIASVFLYSSK